MIVAAAVFCARSLRAKETLPMAQYHKRQAVFCCIVPVDFHPQRPWDVPPRFDSVKLVAKNLSATEANHLTRSLNRRQLDLGLADRKWWFVFHFSSTPALQVGWVFFDVSPYVSTRGPVLASETWCHASLIRTLTLRGIAIESW